MRPIILARFLARSLPILWWTVFALAGCHPLVIVTEGAFVAAPIRSGGPGGCSFCGSSSVARAGTEPNHGTTPGKDRSERTAKHAGAPRRHRKGKFSTSKRSGSQSYGGSSGGRTGRPSSFAAIRRNLRDPPSDPPAETGEHCVPVPSGGAVGHGAGRSGALPSSPGRRQQQRKREELKRAALALSGATSRGFASTREQRREMAALVEGLAELNPTKEPAWSYYGRNNPLTRQLYLSLAGTAPGASSRGKGGTTNPRESHRDGDSNSNSDTPAVASLDGKWNLVYTDVPSLVALGNNRGPFLPFALAKLGRIGRECSSEDHTVRTVVEWKRPGWADRLEEGLLGGAAPAPRSEARPPGDEWPRSAVSWLLGTSESSILQKTTNAAGSSPGDPTVWGVSSLPRAVEVVSPPKPAGTDDAAAVPSREHGDGQHANLQGDGLVAGILRQAPIQLRGLPDAMASLLEGDGGDPGNNGRKRRTNAPPSAPTATTTTSTTTTTTTMTQQKILYLDEDIRIIGDDQNHVTIESRIVGSDCWF